MFIRETLRRAITSFLALPTVIIAVFIALAIGAYVFEQVNAGWIQPFRSFMRDHFFGSVEATGTLLGTIASGVITITSITFSLLLLALQQSAGSLTHQVFDQFLQRRLNQAYFGFFVGMALYALIILASVDPPFNPVLGATLALFLTIVSLFLLLLLIYSTISQMRPAEIMKSIHDHTLEARERQLVLVRGTHRSSGMTAPRGFPVTMRHNGFVASIDLTALQQAVKHTSGPVEVEFLCPVGSYVAFGDTVAMVRGATGDDADRIVSAVENAVGLDKIRRLASDPAYGIEQLETIAWRSISTSQQNPAPGIIAINNLRDLLARWAVESDVETDESAPQIFYPDDVMTQLMGSFESLAVVASESMQHQTYAEIVRTIAITFDRLPHHVQRRAEEMILRSLSTLGDHVLTVELEATFIQLEQTLERAGRFSTFKAIREARTGLAASIGALNSRASRVPGG